MATQQAGIILQHIRKIVSTREAEQLSEFLGTPVKPVFIGGPSRQRVARPARRPGASAPPPGSSPRPNP